jgi:hypothetical protein
MMVFVMETVNIICAAETECWIITELNLYLNVTPLARIRCASERSRVRLTRSRLSVVSLSPRANSGLVPKIHVVFHAFNVALPKVSRASL